MRGVKGDEVLHFLHQGQDFLVPFLRKNVARCLILILKSNCCFNEHFFFLFFFLYFLYLHRVQCYLYTRGGNNRRYRLFNSSTLFYLPFILIFRHLYRNIH